MSVVYLAKDPRLNTVVDSTQPLSTGATGFRAESRPVDMEVAFDDFVVSAQPDARRALTSGYAEDVW